MRAGFSAESRHDWRFGRVLWPALLAASLQPVAFAAPTPSLLSQAPMFLECTDGSGRPRAASGTVIAASSPRLREDDRVFAASFDPADWSGRLEAYDAAAWFDALGLDGSVAAPVWTASFPPDPAQRRIFTSTAALQAGTAFRFDAMTQEQRNAVGSAALVDYLRGDRSMESGALPWRRRGSLLADVVNSDPLFSKAADFGYDEQRRPAAGGGPSYRAYVASKRAGRRAAVFVGANGGMLHAFDAADGRELFAYVPRAMLPQLPLLASPGYVHRYYVDGPLVEGDAHWGGRWRSVIVGTSGAGPKALFALDVTNPASVEENGQPAFGTGQVLWDFTGADHPDLGHITEPGFIASARDGRWYYFVGNGHESANDKAKLLVVDLESGQIVPIGTDDAGGPDAGRPTRSDYTTRTNGLGGVTPVFDRDRNVIAVYAGDRLGRLWKFDLDSRQRSDWKAIDTPLFEAINAGDERQPIMAAPRLLPHPAGGYFIVVGTGKFVDRSDAQDTSVQSVYVLWEKAGAKGAIAADRRDRGRPLLPLRLRPVDPPGQGTVIAPGLDRVLDGEEQIDWRKHVGWYFDLITGGAARGERVLSTPSVDGGFVQFSTFSLQVVDGRCGQSYFYRLGLADNLASAAFALPRGRDVVGVQVPPHLEARLLRRSPPRTEASTRRLSATDLNSLLGGAPPDNSGNCARGTFRSVDNQAGITPLATCVAPPLRTWRELPRGPR